MECGKDGARKRTRTSTTVRPLAPEASASANSAIRAQQGNCEARIILRLAIEFVNEGGGLGEPTHIVSP